MTTRDPSPINRARRRLGALAGSTLALAALAVQTPAAAQGMGEAGEGRKAAVRAALKTGPETRRLRAPLAPAAKPARPLTDPITILNPLTGASQRLAVRPFGRRAVEVRQSNGCVWRREDWFAPSIFWRNCGDSKNWRDGRSDVSGGQGLWPLRVGAEGRFDRAAVSASGSSYERATRCRVTDAVEVLRQGQAPTPAYVVDCNDGKRTRTTWWAPGAGPIAFRQVHEKKGLEEFWVTQ